MVLRPELIEAYKILITDPKRNGLGFKPLHEIIKPSDQAMAKHILYLNYLDRTDLSRYQVPKVVFYIVMDELFPQAKTNGGDLGYLATLSPALESPTN